MSSRDDRRTAHLLFDDAIGERMITPWELDERRDVMEAALVRRVPSLAARALQRAAMKRGSLDLWEHLIAPRVAVREAVLGADAKGPPKVLLRYDEFPVYEARDRPGERGTEVFRRFHDVLHDAGVPYCAAVLPLVPHRALDPKATGADPHDEGEREMLARMRAEGVELALHGLDHRTRHASPRRRSELTGLRDGELRERLDRGLEILAEQAIRPRVFVPPFNRFGFRQYDVLAERFDVVCGGPESVPLMGWHPGPQFRGDSVWLPSYPPLYGTAREIVPAVERLLREEVGTWVPVTLHLAAEADDGFAGLRGLAQLLAGGVACGWDGFLDAVTRAAKIT